MTRKITKKNVRKTYGSTFDRIMSDPKRRAKFDQGYEKFLFSELLLEAMEEQAMTVRKLASQSGVSTTMIQNIRSGKSDNISINTLAPILSVLGYRIEIVKNR